MKSSQIYRGNRELCTGCAACSNICMHNAITMTEDWKGFQYPQIDSQKCVDCNLCQTICPANQEKQPFIFPETYDFL